MFKSWNVPNRGWDCLNFSLNSTFYHRFTCYFVDSCCDRRLHTFVKSSFRKIHHIMFKWISRSLNQWTDLISERQCDRPLCQPNYYLHHLFKRQRIYHGFTHFFFSLGAQTNREQIFPSIFPFCPSRSYKRCLAL